MGDYYLVAVKDSGSNGILIVGLPLHGTDLALRGMAWLTLFIALILIAGAGLAAHGSSRVRWPRSACGRRGRFGRRRRSRFGQSGLTQRVPARDAIPGTEVAMSAMR
ncbi:hypothetical protein [Glutamicibacter nicotianae]|uniref:hypothetical protein n=1 Tax=Glutamicibacter nicotianae TaxID=37929 RepID=UPI00167FA24C|nr:hypothetical protein [Glutamicibacter nicotianae]